MIKAALCGWYMPNPFVTRYHFMLQSPIRYKPDRPSTRYIIVSVSTWPKDSTRILPVDEKGKPLTYKEIDKIKHADASLILTRQGIEMEN
jgi:hypothetical protein